MQARLHNQTHAEMQASQSLLANVTLSARGLHKAVDDAAANIAKMTWFGALSRELFGLGWLVLAVAVLHWFSPNHAKFVAAVIGEFPWTTESPMLNRSHRICDTRACLWCPERAQVHPSRLDVDSPCFGLPSPSQGTHRTCCSAKHYLDSRCYLLPAHQQFQILAVPHHYEETFQFKIHRIGSF